MKANGFHERIEQMLADPGFQSDFDIRDDMLDNLRDDIEDAASPQWIINALTEMHASFPEGTSLRYRSSTNNEDLPGFNGAGLYDSKTQDPEETEEDGIDKSLKGVFASLWNFRAFSERDFHRIDHGAAAMGVLVHPNYSDELANGVAVSFDPFYDGPGRYYVNTQLGEDLITNPLPRSVPEELLLLPDGNYLVRSTSNLVGRGELLMSDAQLVQLAQHLTTIHEHFEALYKPGPGEPFAMEIEFKITSDDILAIKQARPWVFGGASAVVEPPVNPVVSVSATLSGITLSAGAIHETFSDGKTSYTASVPFANRQITVTPVLSDSDAEYAFLAPHDTDANSGIGGHQIDLALGANTFEVEVTAQDGLTKLTYTVVATRAYPELTFTSAQMEVAEGDAMTFTVTRNGTTSETTAFTLTVTPPAGSAVLAADAPGVKDPEIASRQDSLTYTVETVGDDAWEAHADVEVALAADAPITISGDATHTVRVRDNDFPAAVARLSVAPNPVNEDGTNPTVTATVTITTTNHEQPHKSSGTILLSTTTGAAGAADFTALTATTGAITIAEGDFEGSRHRPRPQRRGAALELQCVGRHPHHGGHGEGGRRAVHCLHGDHGPTDHTRRHGHHAQGHHQPERPLDGQFPQHPHRGERRPDPRVRRRGPRVHGHGGVRARASHGHAHEEQRIRHDQGPRRRRAGRGCAG